MNLYLCQSQEAALRPYKFKLTNINVFSIEEAMYHCAFYWKESLDDYLAEDFSEWIRNGLGLSIFAERISNIDRKADLADKYAAFLRICDYLDDKTINNVKTGLVEWENRLEWVKLKERGDYLMNHLEFEKAFFVYQKALRYSENYELLNNIAVAHMKLGHFAEAQEMLIKALNIKEDDLQLLLNLSEAYLQETQYDEAKRILNHVEEIYGERSEVSYLLGEMHMLQTNYNSAMMYYNKAINTSEDLDSHVEYIYRLSDVYVKLRMFDKALETLNLVIVKDKYFMKKQSDVLVKSNNIPAAIKTIEKALIKDSVSVDLWVRLAMYHRMDYDISRAYSAIIKALDLSPTSKKAMLEHARIKKAMGKIKDYQTILKRVLADFKEDYRESEALTDA